MIAAMRAQSEGAVPASVPGISIDSRTLVLGEAFFAITGDARDGHEFVDGALRMGRPCGGQAETCALPKLAPLLVVKDALEGLRDLARAARVRTKAKVIGITGSVGKTSTKEALRLALSAQGETHASAASYNNHWGVPLSLARCSADAKFAVFEMGMNHAGEIEPLTKLVRPQVAIITTIEPVHLEFFPSIEGIADAKAEIFLGLESGGAAVLNRDNPQFARLERAAKGAGVGRVVSFGEHANDARCGWLRCSPMTGRCRRILGTNVTARSAPGRHW
jgi:UDP-N-acetylmuramoyl-tripeptide--D-alanyl-D-alanine ligase